METRRRLSVSDVSSWPVFLAVCLAAAVLAAAWNPVAVTMPVGGAVAAVAMVWGIDRLGSGTPA